MTTTDVLRMLDIIMNDEIITMAGTPISLATMLTFLIIIFFTFRTSRMLQRLLATAFRIRGIDDPGTVGVLQRLLHYLTAVVGLGVALQTVGINLSTLFAAGAVFAVGIGFALQNIAQNFVSGLILLVERSIKPGDVLEVDGRVVRVQEMGIRATIVRTLNDENLIVPNSLLVQSSVNNFTLTDDTYRLQVTVGVTYGSDMRQVRETLQQVGQQLQWRIQQRPPLVLLLEFADSSVVWELSVWSDEPWMARQHRSQILEATWFAFQQQHITIAFPQVDIHLDPPVIQALRDRSAA